MDNTKVDQVFENVTGISGKKATEGYTLTIGRKHLELPLATNFEWRVEKTIKTISISHIYFGNETGSKTDLSFNFGFSEPYKVHVQNVDARCYILLNK